MECLEKQAEAAIRVIGLVAVMALAAPTLPADGTAAPLERVERMVGSEKWHLKVMERDHSGRVTRELGSDDGDTVERRSSYHKGKVLASQETTVNSRLAGHRLVYAEKDKWSKSGKLEYSYRETDTVNSSGDQETGERSEKHMEYNRLTKQVDGQWSPQSKGWVDGYIRTVNYYKDGDMKSSVVERPPTNEKTEEIWGVKGSHGRDKTTRTWDAETKSWKQS